MLKPIHIIPQFPEGRSDLMICGMVGAPTTAPSLAWVQWIEDFFAQFGEMPRRGSGSFTDNFGPNRPRTTGQFKNIRTKLENFICDPAMTCDFFTTSFGSQQQELFGDEVAVRASIMLSMDTYFSGNQRIIVDFSVHCPIVHDAPELSDRISKLLIDVFAPQFGFVTAYPAAWLWGLPVTGQGYVPYGWDSGNIHHKMYHDNNIYETRMFRSSSMSGRSYSHPCQRGYLREVYTINLINDRHLAAPLNGATLGDYIATHGMLTKNIHGSALHRWHVPDDIINAVRNDLEHSGLILGSETEPLALPA